ncbi:hypothetical protein RR48_13211 [Papilio machaon]|uniref:Uncharacterized protein n=1 Tax=Papilio machaon TaxID=76193 RepID=A0A194QVS7_PAPMA|nr:hypothetical protein RR48_13211 [Papilio machaon]
MLTDFNGEEEAGRAASVVVIVFPAALTSPPLAPTPLRGEVT